MSEEEEFGTRGAQGGSSSRGGPWASVLLSINDKLEGIAARLDAVERQQKQDLVERQQQEGVGGSSREGEREGERTAEVAPCTWLWEASIRMPGITK